MGVFDNISVKSLEMALSVPLARGDSMEINNRKWDGLTFAMDGKVIYKKDGKDFISDPTHALFLPSGATYSLECKDAGHFYVLNFLCSEGTDTTDIVSFKIPGNTYYTSRCEKLRFLSAIESASARAKSMSVLYGIISELSDCGELAEYYPVLEPAVRHLEKNYADSTLCNKKLADIAGISEIYFRKLFKSSFGQSPGQYIQTLRINRAKDLLSSGESVSNAALLSGYGNAYHFCRIFKEKTGTTPSEYRRANNINKL